MAVQAQVKNTVPTTNKINVIILDGTNMQSIHKCEIDWPKLPLSARQAHIIPKLAQQSLLLVVKLCAAGFKVIFKRDRCTFVYQNEIVMYGIITLILFLVGTAFLPVLALP